MKVHTFMIGNTEYKAYWYLESAIKYRCRNLVSTSWTGWLTAPKTHFLFGTLSSELKKQSETVKA